MFFRHHAPPFQACAAPKRPRVSRCASSPEPANAILSPGRRRRAPPNVPVAYPSVPCRQMRPAQVHRGMATKVQGLYMAELSKIAARKDDGVRNRPALAHLSHRTRTQRDAPRGDRRRQADGDTDAKPGRHGGVGPAWSPEASCVREGREPPRLCAGRRWAGCGRWELCAFRAFRAEPSAGAAFDMRSTGLSS